MAKKKNEFFEGIKTAMEGGIADMKAGRKLTVRTVVMPDPPKAMTAKQIARMRENTLKVSQAVFARMLNVSPKTVQAWEQGTNGPSGPALRLLRLGEQNPSIFAM